MFDIRTKRKKANLTQDELAQKIGINRATLSKYETGQIEPPFSQLVKISDALDIPIFDFFPDHNDQLSSFIYREGFEESQDELREFGYTFSDEEIKLIECFNKLNSIGKGLAIRTIESFTLEPELQKAKNPPEGEKKPNDGE